MISNPRALFRVAATAEAVTWTLLIIGMVLKYVTETTELGVRIGGMLHGVVFIAYVLVVVALWIDHRWPLRTGVLALVSAVPPWLTLWFERWVDGSEQRGRPQATWRLTREQPRGPAERALAAGLARPGLALVVGLVAVALLTGLALLVGPPVGGE